MEGSTDPADNMVWYQAENSASITSPQAPVHIELGSSSADVARQITQQMQVHYSISGGSDGQMVLVPVPALQQLQSQSSQVQTINVQPIVVTAGGVQSPVQSNPGTILPDIDTSMNQVLQDINPGLTKSCKPRPTGSPLERVSCYMCPKTFSCGANLRDHMRLHTGEKPYKCTECDMEFAQRSNWRLHKRVHTGEKPYMCGICGKTFARSSHLPGHMRIHTGEKPFECETCNHCFPSSQALKNHARTHTGEKPFKCSSCETAFTHSSSLSSHKKKCNGIKRKRGRPIGTGRKPSKRKQPSGRPRGRPKKKIRSGRGRKKLNPELAEVYSEPISAESETNNATQIKKECNDSNNEFDEQSNDSDHLQQSLEFTDVKTLKRVASSSEGNSGNPKHSKYPKTAVRESVRLRIKQETRKSSSEHRNTLKEDPESVFVNDSNNTDIPETCIFVENNIEDNDEQEQSVVLEHNESSINHVETGPSNSPHYVSISVATSGGNDVMASATDLQQEAAITMATLQQQGVLNLAQHQQQSLVHTTTQDQARQRQQPIVTFMEPMDLHHDTVAADALSAGSDVSLVRADIPLLQQQDGVNTSAVETERKTEPLDLMNHQQYITYNVNGKDVHVAVPSSKSAGNIQANW